MPFLCPDGKTLELTGSRWEPLGPWGFKMTLSLPTAPAFFGVGRAGGFEAVEKHTGRLTSYEVREVSHLGQRVVSYEDAANSITTFVWRGAHNELSWATGGTDVAFETFTSLLSRVTLKDGPDGLVVTAKAGTGGSVAMSLAATTLDGLGAISVAPITDRATQIPEHAGRKVRGGILWRVETPAADGSVFRTAMIAGATTLTRMSFADADAPDNAIAAESIAVTLT